jgi:hypothetical protein
MDRRQQSANRSTAYGCSYLLRLISHTSVTHVIGATAHASNSPAECKAHKVIRKKDKGRINRHSARKVIRASGAVGDVRPTSQIVPLLQCWYAPYKMYWTLQTPHPTRCVRHDARFHSRLTASQPRTVADPNSARSKHDLMDSTRVLPARHNVQIPSRLLPGCDDKSSSGASRKVAIQCVSACSTIITTRKSLLASYHLISSNIVKPCRKRIVSRIA